MFNGDEILLSHNRRCELCCAGGYDALDGGGMAAAFGIPELRRQLISSAHGDVLEVCARNPAQHCIVCIFMHGAAGET